MSQRFDVCVRGSGVVGASLALLLAQQKLRVALVSAPKRSGGPVAESDVRAYALNAASKRLLHRLRCWPDDQAVTGVTAMRVHGDDGGVVTFDGQQDALSGDGFLASIVEVAALEQAQANALRFQPHVELTDTPVSAALTVVCEGRLSNTRAEWGIEVDTAPYGQLAIAARLQCGRPHNGCAEQWFSDGEIMAFLPLGGRTGNSVALVWSVSEDREHALMQASPEEFTQAVEQLSGPTWGTISLASARTTWPLQRGCAQRWSGQTPDGQAWILAGDAAHTVHPLAGQGLNLGLADVETLARIVGERDYWRGVGDPRLLRQYERERRAGLAPVGAVMDGLQRLFARPDLATKSLRNWGMRGFEQCSPLKNWVTRQAMGLRSGNGGHRDPLERNG